MAWTHHKEIAVIDRGDRVDPQAFGHDRCVDEAEVEIDIAVHEQGGALVVGCAERFEVGGITTMPCQIRHFGGGTDATNQEPAHLGPAR